MTTSDSISTVVAICTFALALVTAWMAWATKNLAEETRAANSAEKDAHLDEMRPVLSVSVTSGLTLSARSLNAAPPAAATFAATPLTRFDDFPVVVINNGTGPALAVQWAATRSGANAGEPILALENTWANAISPGTEHLVWTFPDAVKLFDGVDLTLWCDDVYGRHFRSTYRVVGERWDPVAVNRHELTRPPTIKDVGM